MSKDKITTIHLKFNPIERQKPTIKKEVGNYNSADNTIDWKITLDCKDNKELKDVTIEDELENGHELVSDSVKVYNGSEKPANEVTNGILIPSSSGFKYKFADNISGIKVITLKTKVSPDLLKSNEADKKVKNTSILYLKDKEIQRSSAEKPINIKWIEKSGKYDGATKKITWTIKLYNNGITDDSNKILLTDTMDSKVKLDIDSVEINGEEDLEVNNVNTTLSKLEISGHLNKNTIIQYTTSVADESIFYGNKVTKVNNTAYLSGDLIPENTKGEAPGVGITSTVIKKSGEVKPSSQSIKFDDDEVDDTEFTYEDNVLIFDFSNKFDVEESDEGYFNKKHTITYTTKIKNFYSYLTEEKKSGSEFNNSVEFKSKEVDSCTVDASAKYLPNIIAKKGSYDYKSNQVNWEITVNSDKVDLDKLEITDTIPEGQEYVKGSLNTKEQDYNPETRTITCDFSKEKKKTKIVKFSTKITDENFFKLNSSDGTKQLETKKVYNEVQLTSNKITGSVLSKGGCDVNISPILKVAEYKNNSNVIKWSIIVNRNCINMGNITVVDDLDPNLTLDTSSIKVYKVPSKSELITNTSLSVEEKVKCSIELPIENFSFPDNKIEVALSDVKESYIVQFETIIDPALSDNKSVSNTAYLEGSTVKEAGREVVENIRFMSGSAIGTGENGKITVLNVDPDEGDKPLKEAEFELYDRFKRKVGETKTTDEDGKVVFEGLKFGVTYTVKEIKAPAGYKIDSENSSWDFKIEENDTVKEKSYTFENKKVKGNIKITKAEFNNELNKLPGALFAVYKDNGDNVFNEVDDTNVFPDILSTGNDGVCLIKDVPYGVYWIKEILAPDSYEIDSTPQRVEVKEEGKTYEVGNYSGKIFFNKL